MSKNIVSVVKINEGIVSRYIKPSFVEDNKILNEAFDLRDRTPPEEFVSFYLVKNSDENSMYKEAIKLLPILPKASGVMILLDIKESLEEINDEVEEIINFVDKSLPHCGLVYLTNNRMKIQEAKTTLSYLAKNRFKLVKNIS
ncbi:MAG: hypothetical protein RBQ81_01390 [Arcobacteraceae bacterium]|nr:hypothetical protein [Arcobacteraceae bacterium]MDY0364495.1 hypothetical protein [Arcobacteraceae bacterium]